MKSLSILRSAYTLLVLVGLCGGTLAAQASAVNLSAGGGNAINPRPALQQTSALPVYLPLVLQDLGTTFSVNNTGDVIDGKVGDGKCETVQGNGVCTLRAAILEANTLPSRANIILPAGTYTLTLADRGDYDILRDLTITGAGAATTIISADPKLNDRVFDVGVGVTMTMSGVTVQGGKAVNSAGGGIYNKGTLVIDKSVIRDNRAFRSAMNVGGDGGGIRNIGTLTITNSTFTNNSGYDDGGGILNNGTMMLSNVTISGNRALGENDNNGVGGGLANVSTTTSVANATIINSTIANNEAVRTGGGIRNAGNLSIKNTIVANNRAPLSANCSGTLTSAGHNLENGDTCKFRAVGDLPPGDPMLGALQVNGGQTQTQALGAGSPAIDAGNNEGCPAADQRGVARPVDGNRDGTAACDIGAYEFTP